MRDYYRTKYSKPLSINIINVILKKYLNQYRMEFFILPDHYHQGRIVTAEYYRIS